MESDHKRTRILSLIGTIMLISIIFLGFFAIPVGITLSSLVGLIYGIRTKDQKFRKWSTIFLVIGLLCCVYLFMNIHSM